MPRSAINTGWEPSLKQEKMFSHDADRNRAVPVKRLSLSSTGEKNIDLVLDGVPYSIKAMAFLLNDEWRFKVIINNDMNHIFTWDGEAGLIRATNDEAAALPAGLEQAISEKLQVTPAKG